MCFVTKCTHSLLVYTRTRHVKTIRKFHIYKQKNKNKQNEFGTNCRLCRYHLPWLVFIYLFFFFFVIFVAHRKCYNTRLFISRMPLHLNYFFFFWLRMSVRHDFCIANCWLVLHIIVGVVVIIVAIVVKWKKFIIFNSKGEKSCNNYEWNWWHQHCHVVWWHELIIET